MIGGENLHLIVSDNDGDVWLRFFEDVAQLADRLLAPGMPFAENLRRKLLGQAHARPQPDHLIEVVDLPLKVMFGIRAVEGDTLMPCFRRNGKHRSVRCG